MSEIIGTLELTESEWEVLAEMCTINPQDWDERVHEGLVGIRKKLAAINPQAVAPAAISQ